MFGAAALATLSAVAAPTASAADVPDGIVWDHVYKAPGVTVYVEEYGDIISVCDSAANGKPAELHVSDTTGNHYPVTVTKGNGSCQTRTATYSGGGRYNLAEGRWVTLQYRGDGGTFRKVSYLNDH